MDYQEQIREWLKTYESVFLVFTADPKGDLLTPDKEGLIELGLVGLRLKNLIMISKLWDWDFTKKCVNPFIIEKSYSLGPQDLSFNYSISIDKYFGCYVVKKK